MDRNKKQCGITVPVTNQPDTLSNALKKFEQIENAGEILGEQGIAHAKGIEIAKHWIDILKRQVTKEEV